MQFSYTLALRWRFLELFPRAGVCKAAESGGPEGGPPPGPGRRVDDFIPGREDAYDTNSLVGRREQHERATDGSVREGGGLFACEGQCCAWLSWAGVQPLLRAPAGHTCVSGVHVIRVCPGPGYTRDPNKHPVREYLLLVRASGSEILDL